MKRVKERWDAESECGTTSMKNLRDNAALKKEPEIKNLILVRKRQEIDRQANEPENETDLVVAPEPINNEEREQKVGESINEEDKELEQLLIQQLEGLKHSTMFEIEPREKLSKLKMPTGLQESADRILDQYLPGVDTIPEITDKVYAMGRAVERKMGIAQKGRKDKVKQKSTNGNRREIKLKAEMKELRQRIARANNELYRRRQKRKATKKEKKLLKQLTSSVDGLEPTTSTIRMYKEQWIDKLRYKKIKLQEMTERGKGLWTMLSFKGIRKAFSGR